MDKLWILTNKIISIKIKIFYNNRKNNKIKVLAIIIQVYQIMTDIAIKNLKIIRPILKEIPIK